MPDTEAACNFRKCAGLPEGRGRSSGWLLTGSSAPLRRRLLTGGRSLFQPALDLVQDLPGWFCVEFVVVDHKAPLAAVDLVFHLGETLRLPLLQAEAGDRLERNPRPRGTRHGSVI